MWYVLFAVGVLAGFLGVERYKHHLQVHAMRMQMDALTDTAEQIERARLQYHRLNREEELENTARQIEMIRNYHEGDKEPWQR